ncbi:hypothetical protein AB1E18_008237 [Capra hircus]
MHFLPKLESSPRSPQLEKSWCNNKRPSPAKNKINFTIAQCLAQDGAHVVVSIRKQQKVNWEVAALQREGLGMTGTVCHTGKGED